MLRMLLALLLLTISTPVWAVTQWNKAIPAAGDSKSAWPGQVTAQWSIMDTLLSNYVRGENLIFKNSTTLTVTLGEVVVSNSGNSVRLFLQDAGNTDLTTANLDTGSSFSATTTYYVYAATSSTTAASSTYYISLSSSAPTGPTYYAHLGSFTTDASGNIVSYQIYTAPYGNLKATSSGTPSIGINAYSYGSSQSVSTNTLGVPLKVAFGTLTISPGSITISNLPFANTASYGISCSQGDGAYNEGVHCNIASASSITITNDHNDARLYQWTAIGY